MLSRVCLKSLPAKCFTAVRFAGTAAAAPATSAVPASSKPADPAKPAAPAAGSATAAPAAGKPADPAKPAAPAAGKPAPPPPRPGPPKLTESPMDYPQVIEHNAQTGELYSQYLNSSTTTFVSFLCSSNSSEGRESQS